MMGNELMEPYSYRDMDSPLKRLRLIAGSKGLVAVLWNAEDLYQINSRPLKKEEAHPLLIDTQRQLEEYFNKKRMVFDLPLDLTGTAFQKKVWEALLTIPYGKTKSYSDLAIQLGDRKAVRAVGGALNKNPVSIIVPCHRVIGTSGDLTGFGGGLANKHYLLELEDEGTQLRLWD